MTGQLETPREGLLNIAASFPSFMKPSFWALPIFGSTVAADRDVFWKSDRVFRFSPSGGLYRRKGRRQKWTRGPTPQAAMGQGWVTPLGGVATLWSGSVSSSVFWKLREISGRLALVLSNSENISCVTFLKHKNSRKQGTSTVASR
jgi:hypothetical protein